MKMFAQLTGAGVLGVLALKLLGVLVVPLLGVAGGLVGLTVGIAGVLLKVLFVVAVGWLALRVFRGRRVRAV